MTHESSKKSFSEKLTQFFTSSRKLLLTIAGILIGFLIVFGIISLIHTTQEKNAVSLFDKIESALTDIQTKQYESSQLTKEQAVAAVFTDIDTLVKRYPKSVSSLQALLLKADYYIQEKDYAKALDTYLQIIKINSKHYITDIAKQNAAAMYEETGNIDKAIEMLEKLDASLPKDSFLSKNHILFTLGRLYEQKQDFQKAAQMYTRLIATGANDDWTKLSQSRIIALKADKKIP